MAGSRIFLAGGTVVGRVAAPGPPWSQTGHNAAAGGSKAGHAFFPFWAKKENSAVPTDPQGLQGDFQFPF